MRHAQDGFAADETEMGDGAKTFHLFNTASFTSIPPCSYVIPSS